MSALRQAISRAGGQFAFQRDQHRAWRSTALALLAGNLALTAALAGYIHLHSTVYVTVAATPDGRLIELTPLDRPVLSDAALRGWVVSAVTEALTLGHHDWRRRLAAVREHFTDDGHDSFIDGLERSLYLDRLRDNLQVASAVASAPPVILRAGTLDGRHAWTLEFPLQIVFEAGNQRLHRDLVAQVLAIRVPREDRPLGIAIQQLIIENRKGKTP